MVYKSLIIIVLVCLTNVPSNHKLGASSRRHERPVTQRPKNIILMIGDGMGLAQVSASLYAQGNKSVFELFKIIGFQKNFASDNLITDSAASATAIACGVKTYNNAIGLDEENQPCRSIIAEAEMKGLATGLLVTSSIVHATPASFVAHQPSRNLYENIAEDILTSKVNLLIGGGKQFFDRRANDERNLVDEMKANGYYVGDFVNDDLLKLSPDESRNFVFFTADNQPLPAGQGRDYLPGASKIAINFLKNKSDKGFFLMIEGSQIDWAGHSNQPSYLLEEMEDFEKTIVQVLRFASADKETLVIVTGDHETGGLAINPESSMKKLQLAYTTNGHTGTMVPVYAIGPGAELFRGIYDNTAIYHKMRQALGFE
jgi:alkaline phosphatase